MIRARSLAALALAVAATVAPSRADDKLSNPAILEQLAKVLNAVVDEKGPTGVVDRAAASDRERIEAGLRKASGNAYERRVGEFKAAWKDKYDHAYNPDAHLGVLNDVPIERFEYQGREYASVNFGKGSGDDEVEIRLVKNKETGNWRLALNNALTGEKLAKRLNAALDDLIDHKGVWPKNESAGYAGANRRILGVFDYDPKGQREVAKVKKDKDDEEKHVKRR